MRKFILSPESKNDLHCLYNYIAADAPETALIFVKSLKENCSLLATNPELGRKRDELYPGLRSFPVKNYVLFYIISENQVDVIRILHGSRDFSEGMFS